MKKKLILLVGVPATVLALSGCASVKKPAQALWDWDIRGNQAANQPVSSRAAPLVVPPDFALIPAKAGAPKTTEAGSREQVLESLFGGPAPRSASERAIINAAGASESGIRSSVGDTETLTVSKGSVTRDIIAAPEGDGQTAQAAIPGS